MGIVPAKVREILKISQETVSLEAPVGEEGDSELSDFIADQDAVEPSDALGETMQGEQLDGLLTTMPERERKVIELRFGLGGETPRTLEEVGQRFGVTRERIRQIEAKTHGPSAQLPGRGAPARLLGLAPKASDCLLPGRRGDGLIN